MARETGFQVLAHGRAGMGRQARPPGRITGVRKCRLCGLGSSQDAGDKERSARGLSDRGYDFFQDEGWTVGERGCDCLRRMTATEDTADKRG